MKSATRIQLTDDDVECRLKLKHFRW